MLVAGSALLSSGCTQALGPGFRFAARDAEIYASAPDTLHIRVVDRLENSGNRTLRSLEVRLPEGPNFGTQNLNVAIEGRNISAERASLVDRRLVEMNFDPPWEQHQMREVSTEWDLRPGASTRGTVAVTSTGFYISDETALPVWQAPAAPFSRGGSDPDVEILSVTAPPDFRVLAPGKPLKSHGNQDKATRRFRLRTDEDYFPYVVAGRYQQRIVHSGNSTVTFLTFGSLDANAAKNAAARLASSMQAFTDFFGPLSNGKSVVRIAESPSELPPELGAPGDPGGTSFPEGALLDSGAIAQGIASEPVLRLAEYELARTWFGWRVRPTPEAQIMMGRGVGLFGLVVAAESREQNGQGVDQRRMMVRELIERYDQARNLSPDKRLMEAPTGYSRAERVSNGYRAALFFVAMEDLCGRDQLRAAFRHITQSRAGGQTGYEEMRSALEFASHQDMAELFRQWLIRPRIPDDFRARYTGRTTTE